MEEPEKLNQCVLSNRNPDDHGSLTVRNDGYFLQIAPVVQLELLYPRNKEDSPSSSVCVGHIVIMLVKFPKLKQ